MIQAPIFHVNGDDPEACARAARLAFDYRETFQRDVVLDIVCYRRYGHNEGDDPSYTQPQMYKIIDQMRSVRKIYTETLVRRGDISIDEAEAALNEFNARLQSVLDEVRTVPVPELDERAGRPRCPWMRRPPRPASNARRCSRSRTPRSVACPRASRMHPEVGAPVRAAARVARDGRGRLGLRLRRSPLVRSCWRARTCVSPVKTLAAGRSRIVTPRLIDYDNGAQFVPLASMDAQRGSSPCATRSSASTRRSVSSTATRSSRRTRSSPGRRSSATS